VTGDRENILGWDGEANKAFLFFSGPFATAESILFGMRNFILLINIL
jgi:hypothetical protein